MSFQGLRRAPSWRSRTARTTSRPSLHQAVHDHVRGGGIFDAGPHFLGIGRGDHRLAGALGIGGDQQAALILEGVVAAGIEVIGQLSDGSSRRRRPSAPRSTLSSSRKSAEPGDFGVPLAEDLVGDAAFAELILDLAVLVRPVGRHEAVGQHAGVAAGVERGDHRSCRRGRWPGRSSGHCRAWSSM